MKKVIVMMFSMITILAGMPPEPISAVDLNRYCGKWFEIARLPHRFQRTCDHNTTAEYRLRRDGKIDVINRCLTKEGTIKQVSGLGKFAGSDQNGVLKVTFVTIFGKGLFWADYWIIGLDNDYNYAIVGESTRKYVWILSRTPVLKPADDQKI